MSRQLAAFSVSLAIASSLGCDAPIGHDRFAHVLDGGTAIVGDDRGRAPLVTLGEDGSAIIYFERSIDLPALAASGRAGRRALIEALREDATHSQSRALSLMREHGVEPRAALWMINAVAAVLPEVLAEELAQLPEVERIGPDMLMASAIAQVDPVAKGGGGETTMPWNLVAIGAPELWARKQRGEGVVVAMLDTGIDLGHPDLASSWRSEAGWYDPYDEHPSPFDRNGHGTQATGLVVGGDKSGEPIGVAPGAQWISAKIFDDDGVASLRAIHLALQWVLDPDSDPTTDDAPDIVIAPWGYSQLVDECFLELEPDIATLRAAQIANVFAAGNSGPYAASSISPANNPSAFAAGAVDDDLTVIAGSARGANACTGSIFPELVAPGANVRTADLTFGGQFPSSYVFVSGTSFSAPHIAGAMALLRGAYPAATVTQLEAALTETALDLSATGADNDSGFGLPDLIAAEALLAELVATPRCTDTDEDGYFVEPDCGSSLDCNDEDSAIHPAACDLQQDRIDQDCDGADRLKRETCR